MAHPRFTDAVLPLLRQEASVFFDSIASSGRFGTLFDADYTYVK